MDINLKNQIEYPKKGIISKEILKDKKIDATLFCMAKGTGMSEHTSTKNGIVYILEGKGIFNLEGKDIKMNNGVLIHMKKNAVHSLKAEEDTAFLLVLVK